MVGFTYWMIASVERRLYSVLILYSSYHQFDNRLMPTLVLYGIFYTNFELHKQLEIEHSKRPGIAYVLLGIRTQ